MPVKNMLCFNREPLHRSSRQSTRTHVSLILTLLLAGGTQAVGTALADDAAGAEWTTSAGTLQGTRFSALTDITPANVGQLKEEFSFKTGVNGSHMGQPLVIGNTLYAVTPYPNKLIAYDLSKGQPKWTYSPNISEYAKGVNCCDTTNRGAAYGDGKIVFNLLDNTTVAVNAKTGKEVWRKNLADPHTGVTMTGAPLIVKGKVFVGTSSGEMGVRGWVQALDLKTGNKLWRAYTTGPDKDVLIGPAFKPYYAKDQGVDLGATSWPGATVSNGVWRGAWKQGGSSVWAYLTYDPELDLLFYGTSQPGVWNPDLRPGDNKWGASIFARRPDTGEAVWAYQVTPHDNWDYDAISENIAVDQAMADGQVHKLLVHFDKNGFAYTFDRATGQILLAPEFGFVNWATHIDLSTGLPEVVDGKRVHQGVITENICPSALGAKGWEPAAFSPNTGLFYVPTFNLCMNLQALKTEYIAGAPYMGMDMQIQPGMDTAPIPHTSELIAWDAAKGQKAWGIAEPGAIYGGVLATAGGVVFYSTMDHSFKAVDANTGASLFKAQLECSTVGNPISFKGPDGKQRIAVFTGVGSLAGAMGGSGACPGGNSGGEDHVVSSTDGGGRVHIFKLP